MGPEVERMRLWQRMPQMLCHASKAPSPRWASYAIAPVYYFFSVGVKGPGLGCAPRMQAPGPGEKQYNHYNVGAQSGRSPRLKANEITSINKGLGV